MKIKFGFLMLGAMFLMASCGGNKETATNKTETENQKKDKGEADEMTAEAATYVVDAAASNVRWEGGTAGVQIYSHYGSINIQEGNLEITGKAITGGSFVVDMTSINPEDENYSEKNTAADLVGHLSQDDFFLVETYPTATFEITGKDKDGLVGNLTIRDKTNKEKVIIESMDIADDGKVNVKGTLTFDRQKYDVKWAHYLKDVALKNNIELQINLVASK